MFISESAIYVLPFSKYETSVQALLPIVVGPLLHQDEAP